MIIELTKGQLGNLINKITNYLINEFPDKCIAGLDIDYVDSLINDHQYIIRYSYENESCKLRTGQLEVKMYLVGSDGDSDKIEDFEVS